MKKSILSILCFFVAATSAFAQIKNLNQKELEMNVQKLSTALIAVKALYIDTVNSNKMTDEAIKAMLLQLDPHSTYSDAKETKQFTEPLNSNFEGIGIQFNLLNDTIVVVQNVPKGPCEKVGILAGDRILSVNGKKLSGVNISRDSVMRNLRGPKGTVANLEVKRKGVEEVLQFRVIRDKIPLYSVDAAYMIRPGIGMIRISSFAQDTHKEFCEAIKKLKEEGMKSLIVDLQQNGGGYLEAANAVASEFLKKGDLVVYTEGRSVPKQTFKAKGDAQFKDGQLVILVDEFTASAAEILSGAVQDHDRGLIVGRRTFGKGLVQRPIDMPDGSMIRLTVSHYYTPSGRCIQKPYEKGKKADYDDDMNHRYLSGELMHIDSIHFVDSLKCYTLNKKRPVYGGGGIMPDVFVPLDTTVYTKYYRALSRKNVILNAFMSFFDQHRAEYSSRYTDFEEFKQTFEVDQALIDTIFSEGEKMKVTCEDETERMQTRQALSRFLKALIARDIWNVSEYFAIINEDSEIVKKALELIEHKVKP